MEANKKLKPPFSRYLVCAKFERSEKHKPSNGKTVGLAKR